MKKTLLGTSIVILSLSILFSAFRIQSVKAAGTIYIDADGSINPPEAPISSLDNITYIFSANTDNSLVVEKSNIIIDGAGYIVQGDGTGNGFTLQDVINVTIRNTRIESCFDGIQLFNSSDNVIIGNIVTESRYEGVGVYYSSDNTVIVNNMTNNQFGIAFYNSSGNSVFHNSFVNNSYQVYSEFSVNNWDNGYPSGGDYWNDYIGTDIYSGANQNQAGSDGIGDTPYNVSENNQDRYPLMQNWANIAIAAVSSSKTAVGQGQKVNITIIVQNQGWDAETSSVTLYANATILSSFTNIALLGRTQTMLNYTWQTASFDKAKYVISANATAISGETNTADNSMTGGSVIVTIQGDINGDGTVNILDAIQVSNSFLATPGSPNWNPNADINSDNIVNILDAIILANHFLQHYP